MRGKLVVLEPDGEETGRAEVERLLGRLGAGSWGVAYPRSATPPPEDAGGGPLYRGDRTVAVLVRNASGVRVVEVTAFVGQGASDLGIDGVYAGARLELPRSGGNGHDEVVLATAPWPAEPGDSIPKDAPPLPPSYVLALSGSTDLVQRRRALLDLSDRLDLEPGPPLEATVAAPMWGRVVSGRPGLLGNALASDPADQSGVHTHLWRQAFEPAALPETVAAVDGIVADTLAVCNGPDSPRRIVCEGTRVVDLLRAALSPARLQDLAPDSPALLEDGVLAAACQDYRRTLHGSPLLESAPAARVIADAVELTRGLSDHWPIATRLTVRER